MSLTSIRRDSWQVKLDPEDGAICTYTEIFGGKSSVHEGADLLCKCSSSLRILCKYAKEFSTDEIRTTAASSRLKGQGLSASPSPFSFVWKDCDVKCCRSFSFIVIIAIGPRAFRICLFCPYYNIL